MVSETVLCGLYEIASRTPGWLTKLQDVCELSEEETGFLCWLDEEESKLNKRLREAEATMRRQGFEPELIACDTDEERLDKVSWLLGVIVSTHDELKSLDCSYFERSLFLLLQRYDHWKKLRNKIRARQLYTAPRPNGISIADIERAREVPLSALVEVDRNHMMLCPFHTEKTPSFHVKDWGYCFGCHEWADALKFLTKVRGMSFVNAVQTLLKK